VFGDSHSTTTSGDCIKFKPAQFNFNTKTSFETKDYCALNVCYGRVSINENINKRIGEAEGTLGEAFT